MLVNAEAVKVDISYLYILLKYLCNVDYILSFFEKSTDFLLLTPGSQSADTRVVMGLTPGCQRIWGVDFFYF